MSSIGGNRHCMSHYMSNWLQLGAWWGGTRARDGETCPMMVHASQVLAMCRHCACQAIYRHEATQCSQPLPLFYRGENRGTESNLCRVTYPWVETELGPLSLWFQSHRVPSEHSCLHERMRDRDLETSQSTCCSGPGRTLVPGDQLRGSESIYWGSWPLWELHKIVFSSPRIMYTVLHKTLRDLHPFIC